ncbi:required for excision 1-B domain-containing protein [Cinclus cinclus]|uniref:required for excision 1-B domain-containing protein n=1 Tax=Cinclus cinclus TaxID=127875 RepID=UPI002E14D23E
MGRDGNGNGNGNGPRGTGGVSRDRARLVTGGSRCPSVLCTGGIPVPVLGHVAGGLPAWGGPGAGARLGSTRYRVTGATASPCVPQTGEAVRELLQRLRALQSERVETYRLFEEGHRAYLSSAPHYDFPRYRQLVHEVTVAFSGISQEVLDIAGRLRDELGRADLAQHLARLQEREQEKLQLTAQLQLARQQAQDQPEVDAHQQEEQELKHKLIKTIEAISEILQDLKYDSEEVE